MSEENLAPDFSGRVRILREISGRYPGNDHIYRRSPPENSNDRARSAVSQKKSDFSTRERQRENDRRRCARGEQGTSVDARHIWKCPLPRQCLQTTRLQSKPHHLSPPTRISHCPPPPLNPPLTRRKCYSVESVISDTV